MAEHQGLARRDYRLLLLYHFKLGDKVDHAHQQICAAFGKDIVSRATCYNWFRKFESGDTSLEDEDRPGAAPKIDVDLLRQTIEKEPRLNTRELAQMFNVTHVAIELQLHQLGKTSKLGKWLPHDLTEANKICRVSICNSLLSRQRTFDWLRSVVTGDEKWVLYYNVTRKRSWVGQGERGIATPKAPLLQKKVMISVWWDRKGVIMWEMLPMNTTVDATLYCAQLDRLKVEVARSRPETERVLLLHDNAPAHRARKTSEKIMQLGFEVLPHPPYSPDLAPTDYHLFRSLQNHIKDMQFENEVDIKTTLDDFFKQKPVSFYQEGINKLPGKWRDVVEKEGEYIED